MAESGRVNPAESGFAEPGLIPKKLRLLMELRRAGIGDARVLGDREDTTREIRAAALRGSSL